METPSAFVFAVKLNDPHIEDMSLEILRQRENGYVKYLIDKYVEGNNQCPKGQLSRKSDRKNCANRAFVVISRALSI